MSILIKDEKAFRETVLTDDRLWIEIKHLLEKTVNARNPEQFRIGQAPGVVVVRGQYPFG